jgi:RNA polymerase sigma-70 factor (ECF subfamily)
MSSDSTHPSLLARVRDHGDLAAWRQFEARYSPLVVGFCRSIGLQWADAEDICQNVMLNLATALPGFTYQPQRGRFRSYLGSAVRHAVIRHAARHKDRHATLDTQAIDPAVAGPFEELWERQWTLHHCRQAMDTLQGTVEPRHLDVFQRLLDGQSIEQVALALDLRPDAIRKIKQRVRDRLREIIARQVADENRDDAIP